MKKIKVFVSSTYEDMKEERDSAFQALMKNGCIIGGMELFTGDNIEKFEVIKKDIEDSDIFLLIMGGRYGTVCPETGKSFIHMEYDYAKELNIPVGVIAISDDYLAQKKGQAYTKGNNAYNEGSEKYNWFLRIVSKKMITRYSSINELTVRILTTISKMKDDHNLDGWIRGDKATIQSYLQGCSHDEIIELTGSTVVEQLESAQKDQYRVSEGLLLDSNGKIKHLKSIFLMQRSSSVILGAESGWTAERRALSTLLTAINYTDNFYHLITLEGIENHIKRKRSFFPYLEKNSKYLINRDGLCAIKKGNDPSGSAVIKKLPADQSNPYFKLDRQVRVTAVENMDNSVEAVFVWNIGIEESCMRVKGPKVNDYFKKLVNYFNECDDVLWSDIERIRHLYASVHSGSSYPESHSTTPL